MVRTLILGLGNSLLSDDAIGLAAVRKLSGLFNGAALDFKSSEKVGLNLIELLEGYDRAIIIDSIITGEHPPGEIIELAMDHLPENPRLRSPHDADFKSAVELAQKVGLKMPSSITIIGIEVSDNLKFTASLSRQLASQMPSITRALFQKIKNLL